MGQTWSEAQSLSDLQGIVSPPWFREGPQLLTKWVGPPGASCQACTQKGPTDGSIRLQRSSSRKADKQNVSLTSSKRRAANLTTSSERQGNTVFAEAAGSRLSLDACASSHQLDTQTTARA